jgi:hypothetical protein
MARCSQRGVLSSKTETRGYWISGRGLNPIRNDDSALLSVKNLSSKGAYEDPRALRPEVRLGTV